MLKIPLLIAGILLCLPDIVAANKIDSLKRELSQSRHADTAQVQLQLEISRLYFDVSVDSSMRYAQKAFQTSQYMGHDRLVIASYLQIGNTHYQQGRYDSAMHYTGSALKLAKQKNEYSHYIRALTATGNIYLRQNDHKNALRYYDSSRKTAVKYKDSTELATAINNVAIIQFEQGNYAAALKNHLQALSLNEKLGRQAEIETTLLNISNIYFRLGVHDKAKEYAGRAMMLARASGSQWTAVSVQTTYAMIYNEEKKYDSSMACLLKAKDIAGVINSPYLNNIITGNMAECHLNLGNVAKAESLYKASLAESEKLNDLLGVALAKGGMGQVMVRKGNLQEGIVYLEDALAVLQDNEMPEQAMHLADTLARTLEKTGRYKEALKYYHISDDYSRAIAKNKGRIAAQKIEYENLLEKKEDQIALLEKDKAIEAGKIANNRIVLFGALTCAILAVIIALLQFRNMMNTRKRNAVITEQKNEIEIQAEKLRRLNAFKDTTFSVLSHDLRSPINALTGTMSMLDEGIITPDEFKLYKEELNNKLQSVTLLLDNLLQWAKSQMKGENVLDLEKISLRRKVLKSFAVHKDAAQQKNITLTANFTEQLFAYADRNQIDMVIRNLLSNAIKFTPENGSVIVNGLQQRNEVVLSITDTGIGMTEEQAAKLFDGNPNVSTHGTSGEKGIGIGLHLSHSFIINNKGSIKVQSQPGKGTTFTITLPAA